MSKASKYVGKFIKTYADIILRSSTQPVRGVIQTLKHTPKILDDLSQVILNPNLENIAEQVVDMVNDMDVIGTQAKLTKNDIKYAVNQWKIFGKEVNAMKRQSTSKETSVTNQSSKGGINDMSKTDKSKSNSKGSGKPGNNSAATNSSKSKFKYGNTVPTVNHPEWYMRNMPTNNLIGINIANRQNTLNGYITKYSIESPNILEEFKEYSVPSTAGIELDLTIPKSATNDWNQGINYLYQNLRSANAGATNYSAGTLSKYVHHCRCLDAALSMLYRAVSIVFSGTFYDALSPQVYFASVGLDYDSFVANTANARDLYYRLSALRTRIAPLNISLIDRTRWLFSNIFKDSDDIKSQNYMFYVDRVYYYNTANELSVVRLGKVGVSENTTGSTFDEFATSILTLFDQFQANDKYQTIAGDILKAYEDSSVIRYPNNLEANLKPVYDLHILTQIQNATLSAQGTIDIQMGTDSNGYIKCDPIERISSTVITDNTTLPSNNIELFNKEFENPIYNANTDVVDKGRLLSSTRLMASRSAENAPSTSDTGTITYNTFGTELVNRIIVVLYSNTDNAYGLESIAVTYFANTGFITDVGNVGLGEDIPLWSWFDYFPLVRPVITAAAVDNQQPSWYINTPVFDFNNFGIAHKQNLDTYNAIATLSMLHTPFLFRAVNTKVIDNI